MANKLYPTGRNAFLTALVDWSAAGVNVKVALLSSAYTYSAAHDFHDDLTGIVATSGNLANKSASGGTADADDITFTAVTGSQVTQFVIFVDSGASATSRLIAHFDTATGLPVTPNGGDITIAWDAGANKIFTL